MCVFGSPDIPPPPPPPEIPQAPTEVASSVIAARRNARSQAASQSGFASTILTGGRGVNTAGLPTGGGQQSILSKAAGSNVGQTNRPSTGPDYSDGGGPRAAFRRIASDKLQSRKDEDLVAKPGQRIGFRASTGRRV